MNRSTDQRTNRSIVIGFDGLSPKTLNYLLKRGLLPNFQKLKDSGYYSALKTSTPPQSPVAWASFITGETPDKHGIFDFITRDPESLTPHLTFSHAYSKSNPMHGTPFWDKSAERGIPTEILFLPNTFPLPSKIYNLKSKISMIAGMGTPCIDGTESTCHFFTTSNKYVEDHHSHLIKLTNQLINESTVFGPRTKTGPLSVPLTLTRKKTFLEVDLQGQKIRLKKGQISPWVEISFKLNAFKTLHGIGRFVLKSLNPLELYLTPINFHPAKSPFPISIPNDFSKNLAKDHGLFSTIGLPSDTWAYDRGYLTKKAFLDLTYDVYRSQEKIVHDRIKNFQAGLFVAYFNVSDPIQHMFYRDQKVINKIYQDLDRTLGKVLKILTTSDQLLVLSDHGFGPLNFEVNLNRYLYDQKLLVLNNNTSDSDLLQNIDWQKTSCYALGFNSLFITKKGQTQKVLSILKKLKFRGKKVFTNFYPVKTEYNTAPDYTLGYNLGFRSSFQTALGNLGPGAVISPRKGQWSGDHMFDAPLVPGILLSNKPLKIKKPAITDVTQIAIDSLH